MFNQMNKRSFQCFHIQEVWWHQNSVLATVWHLLPLRLASTNVRIQWTQFSKLYGVMWATSLMRNARLSQHFTNPYGSWGNNSRSWTILNWLTGSGRMVSGWMSPSRPTWWTNNLIILLCMTSYSVKIPLCLSLFSFTLTSSSCNLNFLPTLQWKNKTVYKGQSISFRTDDLKHRKAYLRH
jgi:hypothetical protein